MISRGLGLLGMCAVVVLAGCDADAGEPATLPDVTPAPASSPVLSPSADPSPTPTPTVEPPVEPADAHEYSAEGVEAFTLYAIDVINYAYQTNDVTTLEQIMTPDCQTCLNIMAAIGEYVEDGGHVEGGQMIVEYISAQGPAEGVRPGAVADLTVTESKTFDGSGQVIESEPDRLGQFVFFVAREGVEWELDGIEFGAAEPASPSPSSL